MLSSSIIPDGNRSPQYWLREAKDRVEAAKRELAHAEEQYARLAIAVAEHESRGRW